MKLERSREVRDGGIQSWNGQEAPITQRSPSTKLYLFDDVSRGNLGVSGTRGLLYMEIFQKGREDLASFATARHCFRPTPQPLEFYHIIATITGFNARSTR